MSPFGAATDASAARCSYTPPHCWPAPPEATRAPLPIDPCQFAPIRWQTTRSPDRHWPAPRSSLRESLVAAADAATTAAPTHHARVPQVRPPATDGAADPRMSTSPPPGDSSGPWTTCAPRQLGQHRAICSCPRAFIQPTLGTKHLQGRVSDLPTRFGSFVLLERRRRLLPDAAPATTAPGTWPCCCACETRRSAASACSRAVPRGSRSAQSARLLGGVEHIEAVLQRRLPVLLPLLLHRGDPGLQARSRIRQDVRERGKSCNARDQVDPVRSSAFWPKNQTMLVGSTPTSTGRRWKKISSRQPTSTNA